MTRVVSIQLGTWFWGVETRPLGISVLVLLLAGAIGPWASADDPLVEWSIDRTALVVGGCCTVTIESTAVPLRSVILVIDGKSRGSLNGFGPQLRRQGQTHVLLWVDLRSPTERNDSDAATALSPLFDAPGTTSIALVAPGLTRRTESVTVARLPKEAAEAIPLLFPTFMHNKHRATRAAYWPLLITSAGEDPQLAKVEESPWMKEEYQTILRHPDWAQVLPALQERYEVRRAFEKAVQSKVELGTATDSLPPGRSAGTKSALECAGSASVFARAVLEDTVYKRLRLNRLLKHLREARERRE